MYFNENFNVFFKLIKVHLLVSELYAEYYYCYCLTIPWVFHHGEKHLEKRISQKFWFHIRSTEM